MTIFSLDPADGGSLEDPMFMHHIEMPAGVTVGHTAVVHLGRQVRHLRARARRRRPAALPGDRHAPPGGARTTDEDALLHRRRSRARSRERSSPAAADGSRELHVAQPEQRRRKKAGKQATCSSPGTTSPGSSVVDFTDPANAKEIAYADPPPLVNPNPPVGLELGATGRPTGTTAGSTSLTSRGADHLAPRRPRGSQCQEAGHLNPQTQEFTID